MKTRELIQMLRSADPGEDEDVCIDNAPVISVEKIAANRNGPLQVLYFDPTVEYLFGGISKAEFRGVGHKVVLHTFRIEDAVLNNPDLPVFFPDELPNSELISKIDLCREQARYVQQVPTFKERLTTKPAPTSLASPDLADFQQPQPQPIETSGWLKRLVKGTKK